MKKKPLLSIVTAVASIAAVLLIAFSQHPATAQPCQVLFAGVWYSCEEDLEHICTAVLEDGEVRVCLGEAKPPKQTEIQP